MKIFDDEQLGDQLKEAATKMPLKAMIDMMDHFMCHAKISFSSKDQMEKMRNLQLA